MHTVGDVIRIIESSYPLCYQEPYDNSGLQVGQMGEKVTGIMLSVETTEAVLEECVDKGCNFLLSHHPILFKPLKRVTMCTYQERCLAFAIKHNIAIYALHTSADNILQGINFFVANKVGMQIDGRRPLCPAKGGAYKLQVYVPKTHQKIVREALHQEGIGVSGKYSSCSFSSEGVGRFIPRKGASPFIGKEIGVMEQVSEVCVSMLVEQHLLSAALGTIKRVHPYEEPAYEIIPLLGQSVQVGSGLLGFLPAPVPANSFLNQLKETFNTSVVAHSEITQKMISSVAICGGSGGPFLEQAIAAGADAYVTGEAKYNDFLDAQGRINLVVLGHHTSEQVAIDLFEQLLHQITQEVSLYKSQRDINPVRFL